MNRGLTKLPKIWRRMRRGATGSSVMVNQLEDAGVTSKIKSGILIAVALLIGCFNVRRCEDEGRRASQDFELEDRMWWSNEEDPDSTEEDRASNEVDQSMEPELRLNQSAIQVAVALVFVGGSFAVMFAVPGGVNELGRAVMCQTIGFNIFLVADTLTLFASLAVAMTLATAWAAKVDYLIRIILCVAAACFVSTFLAAAYGGGVPNNK